MINTILKIGVAILGILGIEYMHSGGLRSFTQKIRKAQILLIQESKASKW